MTNRNLGWWLLVALAIVGLAVAAPAVSAHGDESTQGNETGAVEMPVGTDAADSATWMDSHMTDDMGLATVEEMVSRLGATAVDRPQNRADGNMPQNRADGNMPQNRADGNMPQNRADGTRAASGMNGQGYGC